MIGRKAWLFSKSVRGAEASANLYGLIETAKMNGLEPYAYLQRVFEKLPAAKTVEDFEALLPWRVEMPTSTARRSCQPAHAQRSTPRWSGVAAASMVIRSRNGSAWPT